MVRSPAEARQHRAGPGGRRYFLLLVDDYSRFMWLVLFTSKDEAATALKCFQAEAQTEA